MKIYKAANITSIVFTRSPNKPINRLLPFLCRHDAEGAARQNLSVGGAGLASTFMQLGLIDEYRLYIHPVIIRAGKPMFEPLQNKINLEPIGTHTFGSGVVLLRYQVKS